VIGVLQGLVSTSPLAMVMAYAVVTLWKDNKELRGEVRDLNNRVMRIMGEIAGLNDSVETEAE
jgi:hypothetical protein